MRPLLPLALVLAVSACSDRADRPAAHDASPAVAQRGPDALALRVPRRGGTARVVTLAKPDSAVWSSATRVPPLDRVLAFDAEAGSIAVVDTAGKPRRLDLRLGTVSLADTARRRTLSGLASADGWAIYGIASDGSVKRLTPADVWSFKPPRPASTVFPQGDGSLLLLSERRDSVTLWRMRPPANELTDTFTMVARADAPRRQVGDRVYLGAAEGLVGVRSRGLEPVPDIRLRRPARILEPTPSGDRIYIVTDSSAPIAVVDRYEEEVADRIELPGPVRALRMDPLGRYLLARPAAGDSVWVIALGTNRVTATLATAWRPDLPAVAPSGAIAVVRAADVLLVEAESGKVERTIGGGAADYWHFFFWDGFRPRAAGLDEPVVFPGRDTTDSIAALDSASLAEAFRLDSAIAAGPPPSSSREPAPVRPTPAATPRDSAPRQARAYLVSFATLVSEQGALAMASGIEVNGRRARVISATRAGGTIYRVILGPFSSRSDAERAGRESGRSYWIFEEAP